MKRIAINGTKGAWFDAEKAKKYEEESFLCGSSYVSKATGSVHEHEALYITKGGVYILCSERGYFESYVLISKAEAAQWFCSQSFSDEDIPENLKDEVMGLEVQ